VFIIKQTPAILFGPITLDDFGGDRDQRGAAIPRAQSELARNQLADTILFGVEALGPLRVGFGELFGQHTGAAFALTGAEYVEVLFDLLTSGRVERGEQ